MTMLPALTEAQFQTRVIDTAYLYRWLVWHGRPALTQSGRWATPMQGDRGFPDLVLARAGVVILAELKADKGRLGPGQPGWLAALGAHARLWRPRDWPAIERELRDGPSAEGRP